MRLIEKQKVSHGTDVVIRSHKPSNADQGETCVVHSDVTSLSLCHYRLRSIVHNVSTTAYCCVSARCTEISRRRLMVYNANQENGQCRLTPTERLNRTKPANDGSLSHGPRVGLSYVS